MISGKDNEMTEAARNAFVLQAAKGPEKSVLDFLGLILESGNADALVLPFRVPAGDSFAWIMFSDISMLEDAVPFAATMPVQGGKALRSLTRKENGNLTVIALMRPCEIRAGIELSKLSQVNTDNLILASYDCPGAIPLQDYINDPAAGEKAFSDILTGGMPDENVKTTCRSCIDFSMMDPDIHFGYFGVQDGSMLVIPGSSRGDALLRKMDLEEAGEQQPVWRTEISRLTDARSVVREEVFRETENEIKGFDGMLTVFSNCIGCHNCQAACPICYCRLCYFDSEVSRTDPGSMVTAAGKRGGISLPPGRIMFHTGRMAHMSLSCVSCGQCTDACPVSIPVADVFSFVAHQTQQTFEYKAGRNDGEPLPLRQFIKSELPGVHELVKDAESEVLSNE